jgi:polyferredoxin
VTSRGFPAHSAGNVLDMLVTGIVLIAAGIILGLFFPVMFVAAVAGVVLLVLSLVAGGRRATTAPRAADPAPDRPE